MRTFSYKKILMRTGHVQCWILGILLVLFTNARAEDDWASVHFPTTEIDLFVSNSSCRLDLQRFIGCAYALNALLEFHAARSDEALLQLIPQTRDTRTLSLGPARKDFGLVTAHERLPLFLETDVLILKSQRRERDDTYASWKSLFAERKRIDFEEIRGWVKEIAHSTLERYEAEAVAQTMDALFDFTVDPDSRLVPTQRFEANLSKQELARYGGIGVVLAAGPPIRILRVVPEGPGSRANLRSNDVISHVLDPATRSLRALTSLPDAISWIRGPLGSSVTLRIVRNGRALRVTLVRSEVKEMNVTVDIVPSPRRRGRKFGSIVIRNFSDETCAAFEKLEDELKSADALILDLRGNSGGQVDDAQCLLGRFLGPNVEVARLVPVESWFLDNFGVKRTSRNVMTSGIQRFVQPLVVITDAGTASASEIVAGTIQSLDRGWVLGLRTFGKATSQNVWPWDLREIKGMSIIATDHRYEIPTSTGAYRDIRGYGLTPDILAGQKPWTTQTFQEFETENFALRHHDLTSDANVEFGQLWIQTKERRQKTKTLLECMYEKGSAERRFNKNRKPGNLPDYPRLRAEDAADCLLEI